MNIVKLIKEKATSCTVKYQTLTKVALGYEMYELYKQQLQLPENKKLILKPNPDEGTVLVALDSSMFFFDVICDPTGPRNVTWFINGPHLECELYSKEYDFTK